MKLLITFSYTGLAYNGLKRTHGERTVEEDLLTAIATIIKQKNPSTIISFINISRASTTLAGEHASFQIISLEIIDSKTCEIVLNNVHLINQLLLKQAAISIASIRPIPRDFSARRSCDYKRFDVWIPTFVFNRPPQGTHYYSLPVNEPDIANDVIGASMFASKRPNLSITTDVYDNLVDAKTPPNTACIIDPEFEEKILPTPPISRINTEKMNEIKSGNRLSRLFQSISRKQKNMNKDESTEEIRKSPTTHNIAQMSDILPYVNPMQSTNPSITPELDLFSNLKRSLSKKLSIKRSNTITSTKQRYLGDVYEFEKIEDSIVQDAIEIEYTPLPVPAPTSEEKEALRSSRISSRHFDTFSHIIGLYRGTHNFHNFITGASIEDQSSYLRILNSYCNKPVIIDNMEWMKVTIMSKLFGKHQVRKMIALAIMVTRTNTPSCIVGNSFGANIMDIPDYPPFGVVLSGLEYGNYNINHCHEQEVSRLTECLAYEKEKILPSIYKFESEYLSVDAFIRSLDSHSFLYANYLNTRGVVLPRTARVKQEKK